MPTVRVTSTEDFRINIIIDSEQVCFNETPVGAISFLTERGMKYLVAKGMVNSSLPKEHRMVCGYQQSAISTNTQGVCVNCFHLKKEHPVG